MHKTFYFEPALSSYLTTDRLLAPVKTVNTSLAGMALRSYISLSANSNDTFPGLALGRVHAPLSLLVSHNNIYQGKVGHSLPMQIIEINNPEETNYTPSYLFLFTDRTALVARRENDFHINADIPLLRVLPIVLKFANRTKMRHRSVEYSFHVMATGTTARLMFHTKGVAPSPLLDTASHEGVDEDDRSILMIQLQNEIRSWTNEIDRSPLVAKPVSGQSCGVFGKDITSPNPELDGQPWAWPAAMQHLNFSKPMYAEARRFLSLAYFYLSDQYADRVGAFDLLVTSAEVRQDIQKPQTRIDIAATSKSNTYQDIEACLKKEYRSLLKHEKAPEFLFDMAGQITVRNDRGIALSRNKPVIIFYGSLNEPASNHDRMAAHSLFGP